MIHLCVSIAYFTITVYYLLTVSLTLEQLTLEQRIHASFVSFMMLYSLIIYRFAFKITSLPIFFIIHYCLYTIDGGKQQPFWMSIYACNVVAFKIIRSAESKLYTMSAELHRVLPSWEYEFLYTNEAPPRLSLTSAEQRNTNDVLHEYVKTRRKDEIPIPMSPQEKRVWVLSDNHSIFMNRTDRCLLSSGLTLGTLLAYGLWWMRLTNGFRYYFVADVVLFLSLSCSCQVQLIVYHVTFACATVYLHFSEFNQSLQKNDIAVD